MAKLKVWGHQLGIVLNHPLSLLFFFIILTGGLCWIYFNNPEWFQTIPVNSTMLSTLTSIIVALVTFWYFWETRLLRQQNEKQLTVIKEQQKTNDEQLSIIKKQFGLSRATILMAAVSRIDPFKASVGGLTIDEVSLKNTSDNPAYNISVVIYNQTNKTFMINNTYCDALINKGEEKTIYEKDMHKQEYDEIIKELSGAARSFNYKLVREHIGKISDLSSITVLYKDMLMNEYLIKYSFSIGKISFLFHSREIKTYPESFLKIN